MQTSQWTRFGGEFSTAREDFIILLVDLPKANGTETVILSGCDPKL